MTSPKDCMIDLETMGDSSRAAIVSIGAVKFDLLGSGAIGETFYRNVDLLSAMEAGLEVNARTMKWWGQQSKAARKALYDPEPIHIGEALLELGSFYRGCKRMWSHATFDAVVLASAYQAMGLDAPWHYRDTRDIRTLMFIWKQFRNGRTVEKPEREGTRHNALDDALYQARYVYEMYRDIKAVK